MTSPTLSGEALGGLTAGTLTEHGLQILGDVGIEGLDQPPRRTPLRDRVGDGAVGGSQYLGVAEVIAGLGTDDIAKVRQVRAAMSARPNPLDQVPLVLTDLVFPVPVRLYVRPESLTYKTDRAAVQAGWWPMDASWIADDPTFYSEAQTSHVFGTGSATDGMGTSPAASFSFSAVNNGLRAVSSGRALEIRFTAHGTTTNPYIKIAGDAERTGEIVTWYTTMTGGQVLTTDDWLTARIGTRHLSAVAQSAGSPFLYWPRLQPGTQTIEVGCATGTISGYVKTRDTW